MKRNKAFKFRIYPDEAQKALLAKTFGCARYVYNHYLAMTKEAYEQGADYLGVGAIYPTTTKVITVLTSTATLHDICNAVSIPVNAIGGLNKDNIDVLSGIPIAGICAVSAIMKADDPKAAASELKARAKELGLC